MLRCGICSHVEMTVKLLDRDRKRGGNCNFEPTSDILKHMKKTSFHLKVQKSVAQMHFRTVSQVNNQDTDLLQKNVKVVQSEMILK